MQCLLLEVAKVKDNQANGQYTKKHYTYQLYIHNIPPDDGLQTCPKHVKVN